MAVIIGKSTSETLNGTSSSDSIDALEGNDIINAGAGNDTLYGGSGVNSLYGQAGKDTFAAQDRTVINYSANTVMDFAQGSDKIDVSAFGISSFDQLQLILEASGTKDTYFNAFYENSEYSFTIKNIGKTVLKSTDFIFDTGGARDTEGTAYRDTLFGSKYSETIDGKAGDDRIYAGAGNDTLYGGSGVNTLYGQSGKDTFAAQDRTVINYSANTVMDFTQGSDKIDVSAFGISSFDQLQLILEASGTKDTYFNAFYENSEYSFTIKNIGKTVLKSTDFIFDTGGARDTEGTAYRDTLFGSTQSETIDGNAGDDRIYAGAGNDTLYGGSGVNSLYGQAGKDTFAAQDRTVINYSANTVMDFAQGSDKIDVSAFGISSFDQLQLILEASGTKDTYFNAFYENSEYSFTIKNIGKTVLKSTDFIFDTGGARDTEGTAYRDTLFGSTQSETIDGNAGDDRIYAGAGNDTLYGGSGVNSLYGQAGKDTFAAQDRTVINYSANTVMDFAQGSDKIDVSAFGISSFDQLQLILEASGTKDTYFNAFYENSEYSFTIKNIGKTVLKSTDFTFDTGGARDTEGTAYRDTLFGSKYTETIDGNAGDDRIYAGAGNDTLYGGSGVNTLYGQSGKDTFAAQDRSVINYSANTVMDFTQGSDKIDVSAFGISSFDQLQLILEASGTKDTYFNAFYENSEYSFTIKNIGKTVLKSTDFIFDTGGARDTEGTAYRDTLFGSKYSETIDGKAGDDKIYAGAGNDKLYGGSGTDLLAGGSGKDTFVFDTGLGSYNIDTIIDFSVADDTIWLYDGVFTAAGKVGNLASGAFYAGTKAHDATDRIIYDKTTGKLWYDADGSNAGVAIQFAQLEKGLSLTAAHFDVIA